MELKNFDSIISRIPKTTHPLRVVLAGSEGENMLKGIFRAQKDGFVQPVLVGDRARTITVLEQLGLEREPYTMVEAAPGQNVTKEAIRIINSGDGDILMRGNIGTQQFLTDVIARESNLRTDRIMSPRLSGLSAGVSQAAGALRYDRGGQAHPQPEEGHHQKHGRRPAGLRL